jgi:hypothetical protein
MGNELQVSLYRLPESEGEKFIAATVVLFPRDKELEGSLSLEITKKLFTLMPLTEDVALGVALVVIGNYYDLSNGKVGCIFSRIGDVALENDCCEKCCDEQGPEICINPILKHMDNGCKFCKAINSGRNQK